MEIVPGYIQEICLSIHPADVAQDLRAHWTYLCGNQIQDKKVIPS